MIEILLGLPVTIMLAYTITTGKTEWILYFFLAILALFMTGIVSYAFGSLILEAITSNKG